MCAIAVLTRPPSVDQQNQIVGMPERSTEQVCTAGLEEWIPMTLTRQSRLARLIAIPACDLVVIVALLVNCCLDKHDTGLLVTLHDPKI